MNRTLAQERSAFALEGVRNLKGDREKFAKFAAGLPAMILQNGFGQAMAFLLAKGTDKKGQRQPNDKHTEAFDIVARWLKEREIVTKAVPAEIMKELSSMEQSNYLEAQREALVLLEWVKRYADARLFG